MASQHLRLTRPRTVGYCRGMRHVDERPLNIDLPKDLWLALKHEAVERGAGSAKRIAQLCIRACLPVIRENPTMPLAEIEAAITQQLMQLRAAQPNTPAPTPAAQPDPTCNGRSQLTVPEQVAAAMGDKAYDAAGLEPVLQKLGITSNKLRAYSSSIFAAKAYVLGPDGKDLRRDDGSRVEVRMFVAMGKGRYRVATPDEKMLEANTVLGRAC
jgi:hypothetical protein